MTFLDLCLENIVFVRERIKFSTVFIIILVLIKSFPKAFNDWTFISTMISIAASQSCSRMKNPTLH